MVPNKDEQKDAYVARFMKDEGMMKSHPEEKQRMAAAESKWQSYQHDDMQFADMSKVEIFKAGSYYGVTYDESQIDEIAKNTNFLIGSGKHRAPAKLGHDDAQQYAKQSGLPAVGWVNKVYREGAKLYADFKDVPEIVIAAIQKKLYNSVSSEIYMDAHSEKEFGIKGKVLRAVAFLGADVPKVKGMMPLSAYLSEEEGRIFKFKVSDQFEFSEELSETERLKLEADKASEEKKKKGDMKMSEEEKKAAADALKASEAKTAEALKLAEDEKAKRVAIETKEKDAKIAAFCEANKTVLIPALQPKFKALAASVNGTVKLDDKEEDSLATMLSFTEELMKAKAIPVGETKTQKEGDVKIDPNAVKLEEEKYTSSKKNAGPVDNAELSLKAEKYQEENKCSFKVALLAVAKLESK